MALPPKTHASAAQNPARRARGPVNIGHLTGRIARPALGKRGFAGAEILTHWATIVGADLAAFACPLEVRYPRGKNAGATLHLRVASGAAATLLHMKLPAIVERINRFFGYQAVSQVQAAQGPLPAPPPVFLAPPPLSADQEAQVAGQVATVASEPLRAALFKLGKALQHRRGSGVVRLPSRVSRGGDQGE